MTPEFMQSLCDIIDAQSQMIRQLLDLLAQHQAVDEYERATVQREKEYAALLCGQEGGERQWTQ